MFLDAFELKFNPQQRFETVHVQMKQVYRTKSMLLFFRNSQKHRDMQLAQIRFFYRE